MIVGNLEGEDGRSERIRTSDPCVPNAVLYQTEPHSDISSRRGPEAVAAPRRGLIATSFGPRKRGIRRFQKSRCSMKILLLSGVASQKSLAYLTAPRRNELRRRTGPAGEWCNGNTTVFGTVILGSSPSSPAIRPSGREHRPAQNTPSYYNMKR